MRMLAAALAVGLLVTGCASAPTGGDAAGPGSGGSGAASSTLGAGTGGASGGWVNGAPGSTSGAPGSTAGAPGSAAGQPTAPPPVSRVDSRCPARLDSGQHNAAYGKPVPPGIEVAWVLRCTVTPQVGKTRYLLVERSDSDPSALLTALRAPDEPPSRGACPALAMVVPYFALVKRDGSGLVPWLPVTGCRLPQPPVLQALNSLQFTVISRHPLP